MPESKRAILITGSRAPCALALARTLHAAGFQVYTADSLRPNLCSGSGVVEADFHLPSPRFNPAACADELARLVAVYSIDALIPTCEEIYHLAAERHRLPASLNCFFPPLATLDRLHNKHSCMELAQQLGIRIPPTTLLTSPADLDRANLEVDAVLKRVYSRFSSHVLRLQVTPAEQRRAATKRMVEDSSQWIHQQYIEGHSVCSYSLCSAGRVIHHTAYATPYTVGLGAGIYYQSVPASPSLRVAERLAAATSFTGQLSLDFMENEEGLWLLECNPRATMGLALAAGDAEFARAWEGVLNRSGHIHCPFEAPPAAAQADYIPMTPPRRRRQMALAMLFYGWKAQSPRWSLLRWAADILTTPDVLVTRADLGVAFRQMKSLALYAYRARALQMPVIQFTTHDIEWNGFGERRAEKAGPTARQNLAAQASGDM
ncbi:MAG: hypothetical protein M3Y56_06810 [Armatimonadota bacterium]|nr:hypothetical protein [Armatimonadota bacterium]